MAGAALGGAGVPDAGTRAARLLLVDREPLAREELLAGNGPVASG